MMRDLSWFFKFDFTFNHIVLVKSMLQSATLV